MGERNINLIESNSNCYDFSHLNDFRQFDVHLLHYLRLDRYDLYRFEKKKLLYTTSFVAVVLKKNTDIIFKTAIGPAQSSIVSLKKQTVKQVPSVSSC